MSKFLRVSLCVCIGVFLLPVLIWRAEFFAEANLLVEGSSQQVGSQTLIVEFDDGHGFSSFNKLALNVDNKAGEVFTVKYQLPYQYIKRIRFAGIADLVLSKVSFVSAGEVQELVQGSQAADGWVSDDIVLKRSVQSRLLLVSQILAAALVAYLSYFMVPLFSSVGRVAFTQWFLNQHGWAFLAMVSLSCGVHVLWLVGLWPAQMTNDSWSTVADMAALRLTNWHPYVYTMYALVLYQLLPNIAGMVLAQIFSTSLIMCGLFYFCLRCGVSLLLVLPFFLLYTCSIPIGLMNTMIWKDVPFSIAVFALGAALFYLRYHKQFLQSYVHIPLSWVPLIWFMMVSACHMRHNGLVFYGLLPLLFLGSVRWRDWLGLCGLLLASYLSLNLLIPRVADIQMTKGSAYHEVRTALAIMTHPNFYSEDRVQDYQRMSRYLGMEWQEVADVFASNWYYINDKGVAQHQYKPDIGYTSDGFNKAFLGRLVIQNIPIFLSSRTFGFFHSMALDSPHSDARNGFYYNPMQLTGSNLGPPGNMVFNHSLRAKRPWSWLSQQIQAVEAWGKRYNGFWSPQVLVWNLLLPLMLFLAVFLLERLWSPVVLFILPSTVVAGVMFVLGAGESWRYLYCLYLSALPLIPLYCAQWVGQRLKR